MPRRIAFAIVPLTLLAACHQRQADPGAVSPEEDRLLNQAASSIEAPAPADNATPADPAPANDQGNAQ